MRDGRPFLARVTGLLVLVSLLSGSILGYFPALSPTGLPEISGTPPSHFAGSSHLPTFVGTQAPPPLPSKALVHNAVNPYACHTTEPAPMGIGDFGVDPGTGATYSYNTYAISGEVDYHSLQTYNASITGSQTEVGFQLNIMFVFNLSSTQYVYWTQDVAILNTTSYALGFIDNIWNDSAPGAQMYPTTVTGNGTLGTGSTAWYYDVASSSLPGGSATDPPNGFINMEMQSSVVSGVPELIFMYSVPGSGGKLVTYDNAVFPFAKGATILGFVVDGNTLNPWGSYYDAEFVMGGPGGGSQTNVVASNSRFYLEYWNGHNWAMPPSAYNFGCETAEGVTNVESTGFYDSNGTLFNAVINGNSPPDNGPNTAYARSDVSHLNVTDPKVLGTVYGDIYVNQTSSNNSWVFVNGYGNLTLGPGTYTVYESVGTGSPQSLGSCTLLKGATLTVSASSGCSGGGGNPTINSFQVTPNPATVGSQLSISTQVSGGTAPYTYSYSGLPVGCSSTNAASFTCIPSAAGSTSVNVLVTDSHGLTATQSLTLTVNPSGGGPAIASFSASPNPVATGSVVRFSVSVSGGTPPYSYSYLGLPLGCSSINTEYLNCTPTTSGNFTVQITVTDSVARSISASAHLEVTSPSGSGAPVLGVFTASPNPVTQGSQVSFSISVTGGSGPFSFTYAGLPAGCANQNLSHFSCNPSSSGTFTVVVTVSNSYGSPTKQLTLTVNPSNGGNNLPGNNGTGGFLGLDSASMFYLAVLMIVIVVILVTVFLVSGRRSRSSTLPPPSYSPGPAYPPQYPYGATPAPPSPLQPQPPAPPAPAAAAGVAFCNRCGSPVEPDFMFCRNCGNQIGK